MPATTALGRRRGTRSSSSGVILSQRALVVLAALCVSVFAMGLVLGTRMVLSSDSESQAQQPQQEPLTPIGVQEVVQHPGARMRGLRGAETPEEEEEDDLTDDDETAAKEDDDNDDKQERTETTNRDDDDQVPGDDDGVVTKATGKDDDTPETESKGARGAMTDEEMEPKGGDDDAAGGGEPNPLPDEDEMGDAAIQQEYQRAMMNKNNKKKGHPQQVVVPGHEDEVETDTVGADSIEFATGDEETENSNGNGAENNTKHRRKQVKEAMKHAWAGYRSYAWGADEVKPQSRGMKNGWGGLGTTMVDSLDTLWLMGLKDEFYEARDWVRDSLTFSRTGEVSVFETTIRSLGGLLAAYDWSGDGIFLEKADELGALLIKAFDSPSGLPFGKVYLNGQRGPANAGWTGSNALLAEVATLQVEFRYLAAATGKGEYAQKAEHVFDILNSMMPSDGLFPMYFRNTRNPPEFANQRISFGAMGDSAYEYMLKVWLQGGRKEDMYREMYDKSMQGMHDHLLKKSTPSGLAYIADRNNGRLDHKMDHLVCFMGGLLALGAYTDPLGLESERAQRDLATAKALTYTCHQMYARMPTGLAAEFVTFREGSDLSAGTTRHYILRPEAVESFYILYRLTGDTKYQDWGWEAFEAMNKNCRTEIAFGAYPDVTRTNLKPNDSMESFFLAETLKYLFLLFDPDSEVDILDKHVFNTEAHPLRILPLLDSA